MRERFVVANRIRLHCVEVGRGPLVLLVHGWPEFWWSWRHTLPALASAGYRAVAVDLPGYGHSDKPVVAYDEHWVNQTLAGAIEALGADRAVVVGHDWGGLLVWPFARRYPDLTAGVVGVNTPDLPRLSIPPIQFMRGLPRPNYMVQFQDRGPAEWFLSGDVRGWLDNVFLGPATRRKEAFPPEVIERYAEQFASIGSVGPPLEYYRSMDRNWELAADLPERIDAPALMVMAADDPVLTPALADGMEARVPNLRKVLIEECGHWTQQEQPEQFNAALLDWLSTLPRWS